MKNLLTLPGARVLSKGEQKSISGGVAESALWPCVPSCCCPLTECCSPNPGAGTLCGEQYTCSFLFSYQAADCGGSPDVCV